MGKIAQIPRTTSTIAAAATTATFTIASSSSYTAFSGIAKSTRIEIPNWTNDVSLEYKISDPNGKMIYHADGLARNQTAPPVILTNEYPIYEGCVILFTLSGAPGTGGGSIYTTIDYERK